MAPPTTTESALIIGIIACLGLFARNTISVLWELFKRSQADKKTEALNGAIVKKEQEVNELNKNSTTSLDEYRKLKGQYDSDNGGKK